MLYHDQACYQLDRPARGVDVKYFKVTFKDGKSVTIEKPDDVTEEGLRAMWKDGKNLELNEVVYRTEQIASLAEVKPRGHRAKTP
jgi:hypothetical protein